MICLFFIKNHVTGADRIVEIEIEVQNIIAPVRSLQEGAHTENLEARCATCKVDGCQEGCFKAYKAKDKRVPGELEAETRPCLHCTKPVLVGLLCCSRCGQGMNRDRGLEREGTATKFSQPLRAVVRLVEAWLRSPPPPARARLTKSDWSCADGLGLGIVMVCFVRSSVCWRGCGVVVGVCVCVFCSKCVCSSFPCYVRLTAGCRKH